MITCYQHFLMGFRDRNLDYHKSFQNMASDSHILKLRISLVSFFKKGNQGRLVVRLHHKNTLKKFLKEGDNNCCVDKCREKTTNTTFTRDKNSDIIHLISTSSSRWRYNIMESKLYPNIIVITVEPYLPPDLSAARSRINTFCQSSIK